ncbi:MAG: DUF177 domain-containing protein [Chloroflexi bacterium]|nr:DUF177 domain-containing protein [Chloroflexota bacterium]
MALLETGLPGGGVNLNNRHPLRLNVGFLLHESVGYSRTFDFELPSVQVSEDLDVSHMRGQLRLTRTAQGLYGQGRLQVSTPLECVRCLASYDQEITARVDDLFFYPPGAATEPLLAIPETAILDLGPILREYFLLDLPLQPVCRPDCKGLCPECGNNLNEGNCRHPSTDIDPRLAGLQSLLSQD